MLSRIFSVLINPSRIRALVSSFIKIADLEIYTFGFTDDFEWNAVVFKNLRVNVSYSEVFIAHFGLTRVLSSYEILQKHLSNDKGKHQSILKLLAAFRGIKNLEAILVIIGMFLVLGIVLSDARII